MIDRDDHQPNDVLDRATEALRDAPQPDGPSPELVASTVEAVESSETPPERVRLKPRRKLMYRIVRYGVPAAAAALVIGVIGHFWLGGGGTGITFAEVIENVQNAESVSFTCKQQLGRQPVIVSKMYIQGEKWRSDMMEVQGAEQLKEFPVILSLIVDGTTKESLQLDHVHKTAMRIKVDGRVAAELANTSLVQQFRNVKQEDAELTGQEQRNGRTVQVYRLTEIDLPGLRGKADEEGEEMKVWVDQQSGLPVRVRIAGALSRDRTDESFLDFDEFVWNEPLDPGLLSLEIPAGYALKEGSPGQPAAEK